MMNDISIDEDIKKAIGNLNDPSDIKGMTKQQKLDMWLIPLDNSDTDGDGLTDKLEIENNLDPTVKVDINKFMDAPLCDGLLLKNQTLENTHFGFNIIENYKLMNNPVDVAFRIKDHTGEIEIDLSKYCEVTKETTAILIPDYSFEEPEIVKIKSDKFTLDLNGDSYVLCVSKTSPEVLSAFINDGYTGSSDEKRRKNTGHLLSGSICFNAGRNFYVDKAGSPVSNAV